MKATHAKSFVQFKLVDDNKKIAVQNSCRQEERKYGQQMKIFFIFAHHHVITKAAVSIQRLTILTESSIVYCFEGRPTLRPSSSAALLLFFLFFGSNLTMENFHASPYILVILLLNVSFYLDLAPQL